MRCFVQEIVRLRGVDVRIEWKERGSRETWTVGVKVV